MWIHALRRFLRLHRAIAVYAVVSIVAIIGILFGIIPALGQVTTLMGETNALTGDITKLKEKVQLLNSYDMGFLEQSYADIQAALPEDKSIDTLISTIENTAGKQGLTIDSFNLEKIGSIATGSAAPVPVQTKDGSSVVRANIAVTGDLTGIRNFLDELVKVRRLVRVRDASLSFLKTKQAMSADIDLDVFYQPLPTTLGKASESIEALSQKQIDTLGTITSYPVAYQVTSGTAPVVGTEPKNPSMVNPFNPNPE